MTGRLIRVEWDYAMEFSGRFHISYFWVPKDEYYHHRTAVKISEWKGEHNWLLVGKYGYPEWRHRRVRCWDIQIMEVELC